jgi:hypothetical protein
VWVRRTSSSARDSVAPSAALAASASPNRVRPETPTVAASAPTQIASDVTRSRSTDYRAELDCFASAGIVIVGRWQNALDKRLANDIAIALGGAIANEPDMVQAASAQQKVQQTEFRWPATQTGDASFAAACGAFKAFVRGQAERAHARCVVLFGDVAAALAADIESAVAVLVVRQPSIGALRADPNAKKALWLNVSQNVLG